MHHRGYDQFNKKINKESNDDEQKRHNKHAVSAALTGVFRIVKHLFSARTAPVRSLLTDKTVTACTNDFFRGERFRHVSDSFPFHRDFIVGYYRLEDFFSVFIKFSGFLTFEKRRGLLT